MVACRLLPLRQLSRLKGRHCFVTRMTLFPQGRILSGWDGGLGTLLLEQGMTGFSVVGSIRTDLFYLASQRVE